MIHLEDKIPMRSALGLALEFLAWKGRQMNGLHGMKEKERLVWFFFLVALEKLEAFLEENLINCL